MQSRRGTGGVVWPIILIGVGVILLLTKLGRLDWGIWDIILRLWPILLVGAGLELLIGRRSIWGALVVATLLAGTLAGAVVLYESTSGVASFRGEAISHLLQGARRAQINIDMATGALDIGEASDADILVKGNVPTGREERIEENLSQSGETAHYTLRSRGPSPNVFIFPWNTRLRWSLDLNPKVPLTLRVTAGAGTALIDASKLTLSDLTAKNGVGSLTLILPEYGRATVTVEQGVGQTVLRLPESMAAKIRVVGGLGPTTASARFVRRGDVYITTDYTTAEDRVEVEIRVGVGPIIISDYGES